ncbi:uncharacterized protein LOC110977478 [Acanthaster planci]|uniref:Uncharacterized protein LOC110977478 n=1 Tax=Acanthaster planci TaxID=133434 RepID=A0A8B7Y4U3_ACAPL|nr:uncharacterized protein LOC110977478 [Acanthaster planci]
MRSTETMAGFSRNQPVESTFPEYLNEEDDEESPGRSRPSELNSCDTVLQRLSAKLKELEEREASTRLEVQTLKLQVEASRRDHERIVLLEMRKNEAEAYADAMATERAAIARERDQVKSAQEERIQQVRVALAKAEAEREKMEKDYQAKLAELKRKHNAQNNTLQLWEAELRQLRDENAELKRENNFLRETFFAVSPYQGDSQRLSCFSCGQGYSAEAHTGNECTFHPLPPVPPLVWHRWQHEHLNKYQRSAYRQYFYWSCCNTLAAKGRRPEGCRRGPHHQKWEMDVVMKRVMLSRDILNENDEQRDPRIF